MSKVKGNRNTLDTRKDLNVYLTFWYILNRYCNTTLKVIIGKKSKKNSNFFYLIYLKNKQNKIPKTIKNINYTKEKRT